MSAKIGAIIRRARSQQGLSQSELAKRMGIYPTAISWLENGHHDPSCKTLSLLEIELGRQVVIDILAQVRKEVRP